MITEKKDATLESIVHRSITMHPTLLADTLNHAALKLIEAAAECMGDDRAAVKAYAKAAHDSAAWLRDACGADAYAAIIKDPARLDMCARHAARLQCLPVCVLTDAQIEYANRKA